MSAVALCALEDVPEDGSAGFVADLGTRQVAVMVIRKGGNIYVYENSCPHIGAPLDFISGQFLDHDRRHILCSTHAALFRIEDGECIAGPCAGDRLTQINAEVRDGIIFLD